MYVLQKRGQDLKCTPNWLKYEQEYKFDKKN